MAIDILINPNLGWFVGANMTGYHFKRREKAFLYVGYLVTIWQPLLPVAVLHVVPFEIPATLFKSYSGLWRGVQELP